MDKSAKEEPRSHAVDAPRRRRRTLKRGSRGEDVATWQRFLVSQGFLGIGVDKLFGEDTQKCTREFQRRQALAVDGIVGPACWAHVASEQFDPTQPAPKAPSASPQPLHRAYRPRNKQGVRVQKGAGVLIRGTNAFEQPLDASGHLSRAVWLTAQVEGAKWGTVQSYDGAGMSGGLLHHTALFPKTMKAGQLWELLGDILTAVPDCPPARAMTEALQAAGWELSARGKLLKLGGLHSVNGEEIRRTLTPPDGNVPKEGEAWHQACRWASLFHELLSAEATRPAQIDYAARWLCRARSTAQRPVYRHYVGLDSPKDVRSGQLPPEVDLAMCVYHVFVVSAPSAAAGTLDKTLHTLPSPHEFSALLPRLLGQAKRSNFRKRYGATRKAALAGQALGLWEPSVVQHVMPELANG